MAKRRQRRSAEQWAREVEIWRGSGLSAEEYARRNGLPAHRLVWWGRRSCAAPPTPRLVALEASDRGGDVLWEVQRHDGARFVVYGEMTPALAKSVVGALLGEP
jgi:hypothetical protein